MNTTSVSTILKDGMIVRTRICASLAWYENIIYKCENDTVYIALTDDCLENIIMPGSTMIVKHTNEYFEYLFEGIVSELHPDMPRTVKLTVTKAEELINTRTFPRYEVYLASNMTYQWDDKPMFCIVTNFSLGGLAFFSKQQFDYGEELVVNLYLSDYTCVKAKGKIIRRSAKTSFIDYSMQFTEMDEYNNTLLAEFISKIEEHWAELQNNYSQNIKKHFTNL